MQELSVWISRERVYFFQFSYFFKNFVLCYRNNEKKPTPLYHFSSRYKLPKKIKEEDTESKSEINSGYKKIMFANTRILLGESYQADMPEFLLNKSESKKK